MTSYSLQSSDQDLNTTCALYESLHGHIQAMRSIFSDIGQKAKDLTECDDYEQKLEENTNEIASMMISVVPVVQWFLIHLLTRNRLLRSLRAEHFLSSLIACSLPCQNARKLIRR